MTEDILQYALLAVFLVGIGTAAVRYHNSRQGSTVWAVPTACIAFSFSAASAILAIFMAVLGHPGI